MSIAAATATPAATSSAAATTAATATTTVTAVGTTVPSPLASPSRAAAAAPTAPPAGGLEGVVVAETRLSDVDGERGRLVIRGHDVEELARRFDFEALCALLWTGRLPDAAEAASLRAELGRARQRAFDRLPGLGDALEAGDAMDALRAALAHLRVTGDGDADESRHPAQGSATASTGATPTRLKCEITAAVAVFAAAWARRRRGEAPLPPDPALGHAADFLRMAGASVAKAKDQPAPASDLVAARAAALDAYLVTAADHGMNASTFTARVVASTQSDAVSAVVAALGALKGPLHGGAPGPVLEMLDAIGAPAQAAAWIARRLAAGERIMGMGHRVYRVRDPRAAVLERAVERLCAAGAHTERLALARAVEAVAVASLREHRPERRMAANVEFYTAVILDAVGLPQELFTATFAVARVAGWLAHIDEQRALGRLIRPASRYVGPMPEAMPAEATAA